MKRRHAKRICGCPKCIKCGCGQWWSHHKRLGEIDNWLRRIKL